MILRQNPYGRRNRPAVNYQKQMQNQYMPIPPKQRPRCPSGVHYVGNIFLLGVSTLLSELINLRAATTLEYLLEPFQCEDGASLEQDVLAAELEDVEGNTELLEAFDQQNG